MNKRGRKKVEKMKRQRVHKILDAVLDVNSLERRTVDLTGELPTAFFGYSGHTNHLSVEVFNDGWGIGKKKSLNKWIAVDSLTDHECNKISVQIKGFQKCPAM